MKKILLFTCLFSLLSNISFAFDGDLGLTTQPLTDGSSIYPWLIEDKADFDSFCSDPSKWSSGTYTDLNCDLSLTDDLTYLHAPIAFDTDHSNVDFDGTPYNGIFNGNSHTVTGLTILAGDKHYLGLFGHIGPDGQVFSLNMDTPIIQGFTRVGAIAGCNSGLISNCSATGDLAVASVFLGGLVGDNQPSGSIIQSSSSCTLTGPTRVGGLCGRNFGSISQSYSNSNINATAYVGGFCGINMGIIDTCYSLGSAYASESVGGFCGYYNDGCITQCYSATAVSVAHDGIIGGMFGVSDSNCFEPRCFWDISIQDQTLTLDYVGDYINLGSTSIPRALTSEQMQSPIYFLNNGWDPGSWIISENDFPHLAWEPVTGDLLGKNNMAGSGTKADPWQIATPEDLVLMGSNPIFFDDNFVLVNDIDLAGYSFDRSVIAYSSYYYHYIMVNNAFLSSQFNGTLNGNGYKISNLAINVLSDHGFMRNYGEQVESHRLEFSGGLFGRIGADAEVTGLSLENVNIQGYKYIAGFCATNFGKISQCSVTGVVTLLYTCGGFCVANAGTISECYFEGIGNADQISYLPYSGNFCHLNAGTIQYCYANNDGYAQAGFCYENQRIISECYAVPSRSSIGFSLKTQYKITDPQIVFESCFWDCSVADAGNTSSYGVPLTTEQMQDVNTYLDWSDKWVFTQGQYPILAWQVSDTTSDPTIPDPDVNTWQIATVEDLLAVALDEDLANDHYILLNDLDLSGLVFQSALISPDSDPDTNFNGIEFNGIFDGNNHTISGLSIAADGACCIGLFGQLGPNAVVSDLTLDNVNITGDSFVGAICSRNFGTIYNCRVNGSITSGNFSGGIAGMNKESASIDHCSFDGEIIAQSRVGGITGRNYSNISCSYSNSTISGSDYLGGLCGYSSGKIDRCYSLGIVYGTAKIGGLCGRLEGGIMTESFSAATIIASDSDTSGGFCGDYSEILYLAEPRCFWDSYLAGGESHIGAVGLGTNALHSPIPYTAYGWDSDSWVLPENDYPHLAWELVDGNRFDINNMAGSGTKADPWQIATPEDLVLMGSSSKYLSDDFILIDDIDLSDYIFGNAPIASANYINYNSYDYYCGHQFNGSFDGNGHSISGLNIQIPLITALEPTSNIPDLNNGDWDIHDPDFSWPSFPTLREHYNVFQFYLGGLFGQIGFDGKVTGLYLDNVYISGSYYAGGLCGINLGTIDQCAASGYVTSIYSGGLLGVNFGRVNESKFDGESLNYHNNMNSNFCSFNFGTISYSYTVGDGNVHSGFCIYNGGDIYESFAAVNSLEYGFCGPKYSFSDPETSDQRPKLENCLWNRDLSADTSQSEDYSLGLTTAQMQNVATYIDLGWSDKWVFTNGQYPKLAWETDHPSSVLVNNMAGSGSQTDPWQVAAASDLIYISYNSAMADDYFILIDDIDLNDLVFNRAVISPDINSGDNNTFDGIEFNGSFDGRGHTISNLTIFAGVNTYIGLFGQIGINGIVTNLNLNSVDVNGYTTVGGICGKNIGTITQCSVKGTVLAITSFAGGITGLNKEGYIQQCYTDISVFADTRAGCIVGTNLGDVIQSYCLGLASGSDFVGGLCGINNTGRISKCYSAVAIDCPGVNSAGFCGNQIGNSAYISSCFWDITESEMLIGYNADETSPGEIIKLSGLPTIPLQTRSTYTNTNWDFNAESFNGTANIWHMPYQTAGYPMLWFQRDIPGDTTDSYGITIADFATISTNWLQPYNLTDLQTIANHWLEGI